MLCKSRKSASLCYMKLTNKFFSLFVHMKYCMIYFLGKREGDTFSTTYEFLKKMMAGCYEAFKERSE